MLALLPEPDPGLPRLSLRDLVGPNIRAVDFAPELHDLVRDLELGRIEPQPLKVCSHTRRVLVLEPEQVKLWVAYKLGAFSAVPVLFVTLTQQERTANAAKLQELTRASTDKLLAQLDAEEAPLREEDLPLDDDWALPEEEDDPEEDRERENP